jgi:two-component system sensor kinase FixL
MPKSPNTILRLPIYLVAGSVVLVTAALLVGTSNKVLLLLISLLFLSGALISLSLPTVNSRAKKVEGFQQLEQNLGLLVQHIKDYAIFLIDPEGRIMSWNKGAEQIKGYTEAEILGKPISIFYTEEESSSGEPAHNLQRAVTDGRYESVGLRRRKDGSVFYADVVFTPIYDDKGILKGFIKITRDISEQKKTEEEIMKTLQREKDLSEMKSRFITLASHEFNTPLSVILSSTSLIEKYNDPGTEAKRLKHTQRIKSNVNNLKQILNDFLSLEKLEAGIVKNITIEVDPVHVIGEIIQEMEEFLKEGQHVELNIEGGARPIAVDTHLLRNILTNLLSNAIKYSPEQATIAFTLIYQRRDVIIRVRDEGIGIPAEEQAQLFQRFFRASNTTNIEGTGLGLSIVRRYLDLMGGRIDLISTPGLGSIFIVTLPNESASPNSAQRPVL